MSVECWLSLDFTKGKSVAVQGRPEQLEVALRKLHLYSVVQEFEKRIKLSLKAPLLYRPNRKTVSIRRFWMTGRPVGTPGGLNI